MDKKRKNKHLKTNNGRNRTHINGVLNLATKELIYVEDELINSQTMIFITFNYPNLIIKRLWKILKKQGCLQ